MAQTRVDRINQVIPEVVDNPVLEETQFSEDMQRWLANLVDVVNASLSSFSNAFSSLIASGQSDVGGAISSVVPLTGVLPGNYISVKIISTTNPNISLDSAVAGTNNFTVTFKSNPGASAIIVYQAYTEQPT